MKLGNIALISVGPFEEGFLKAIASRVSQEYRFPVSLVEGHMDLSEFYDPSRGQYNGNKLLMEIDRQFGPKYFKTFGLFSVDLFIPILTYIFGQAYLNGRSGIASVYRFSNERYGMKTNDALLLDRFGKEVIHEVGHTFGLLHCHIPDCVMRSSTYVEDVDQKSSHLCQNCRNEVGLFELPQE